MALAKRKYCFVDFRDEQPVPLFAKTTNAVATAADNQEDYMYVGGDKYFEHIQTGANATIMYADAAGGWTVPIDNTDADGVEITQGILASRTPMSFTIGTDPAFFLRVGFKITTVAGADAYGVGFRELGAYTDITTPALLKSVYDEKAMIIVDDNAGALKTTTSLSGTDVTTALAHAALADATWCSMEVKVSAAGVPTFRIGTSLVSMALAEAALAADASAPTVVPFTAADVLVPSIVLVATGGGAPGFVLCKYECGHQV